MVKAILRFENTAFDAEGDFGVALVINKDDKKGITARAVSAGSGNVATVAYGLGQIMGRTLEKLAMESESNVRHVFTKFADGMFDGCEESEENKDVDESNI